MQYDYFLVNRALQVQRMLDGSAEVPVAIPDRHSRAGCSRTLSNLYRGIDRIRNLPVGDKETRGLLAKLGIGSLLSRKKAAAEKPLLTNAQRELLVEFERNVVRARLEDDPESMHAGTLIFNAILADHEYFNGLMPLPQFSDDFAFELLFPSWLNLNTVMVQPAQNSDQPRFDPAQQRAALAFLEEWQRSFGNDDALVSTMTLIANRLEPPDSHLVLQRLIDVSFDRDGILVTGQVERLSQWQQATDSATELTRWTEDFLMVRACNTKSRQKTYDVAQASVLREELPRSVRDLLTGMQDDEGRHADYVSLLRDVSELVQNGGGFDSDLEVLFNEHPCQIAQLFRLVVTPEPLSTARPRPVQSLIAGIAARERREDGQIDVKKLTPFARDIAPRMDQLAHATLIFFQAEFIRKEANRAAFLGGCQNSSTRTQLARQLIKIAQSAKTVDRFLQTLAIAAILDPAIDVERLQGILSSITVLQLTQMERSIGRNELKDLIGDIRQSLPDSLSALANPLAAALNSDERLAKLYLTLNEQVQILQHSGNVSNFGVTRASFSHLSQLADDE